MLNDIAVNARYPLTPAQQGMLMYSLRDPSAGVYVQQMICTLHEAVDLARFQAAWECIVDRHAVLRTAFHLEDGSEPDQEVVSNVVCHIEQCDWTDAGSAGNDRSLDAFLRRDRHRAFALDRAPLWRLCMVRLAERDYRLVWTSHHALLDGRSRLLLLQELFDLYDTRRKSAESCLELPCAFEGYVRWLSARDLDRENEYWRQRVKGFPRATPLPGEITDRNEPKRPEDRHRTLQAWLTEQRTSELQQLADAQQVTFNTLLQGAWALLLSRFSGADDVLFGTTRACRSAPVEGIASIVGLLINTVPLRTAVPASAVLVEWLRHLRSQWVAMRDHEHASLAKIQAFSDVTAGEPLFESLVVFENFQLDSILKRQGGAWAGRSFRLCGATNYPLVLSGHLGPRLLIELTYDSHRVEHDTATRILGHVQALLDAFAAHPGKTLGEFAIVSASERRQLLIDWNPGPVLVPRDRSVPNAFEAQVARAPGATALAFEGETWTYEQVNAQANRLAHCLRALGVGPETPVAIFAERSPQLVIGMLGIAKAGGAYVPLDPSYPKQRLEFMLRDAQAKVVLTQSALLVHLPQHHGPVICLDDASALDREPATNPLGVVDCNHLAYIMYTSGSTGAPKGVLVEHRSVLRLVLDTNYLEVAPTDCIAQVSNPSFDAATFEVWGALLNGAKLVIFPRDLTVDPERVAREFRAQRITISFLTTQLFNHIVDATPDAFCGLRYLLVGGEKADPSRFRDVLKRRPPQRLLHMYGPTETATFATYFPVEDVPPDATSIPIGRPIANTRVLVLDAARQLTPIGAVGELCIGGEGLARGYLARPELTAERFVPDPFSDPAGARLYRTGDLVRWRSDGNLEFVGRLDNQVKLRGFRIELDEIEAVLAQHPHVRQAVVLLREDRPGEQRLAAYVVPRPAAAPLAEKELRRHLRERLPEYMVPAAFVLVAELPLSPTGKVDRRALPAVSTVPLEADPSFVPPRTPTEKRVTRIFAELSGRDRVGMHDDFFEMGGDSLLAVQAASRIRRELGVHLPLNSLFETATPASLLRRLGAVGRLQAEPELPIMAASPNTEPFPLLCSQLQFWSLRQNVRRSTVNICRAHRFKGRLYPEALREALQSLLQRHEAFRTNFAEIGGVSWQVVSAPGGLDIPLIDLSSLPECERLPTAQRMFEEEKRRTFDLTRDSMLRAALLQIGRDDHVLVLNISHMVSDGRSMTIFYRELPLLYDAFSKGQRPTLPPLPIQPRDFARWEQRYLQGEVPKRQTEFWRRHLANATSPIPRQAHLQQSMPLDDSALRHSLVVTDPIVDALQEVGRQEGCTLAITLFAAWNVLLSHCTGRTDILTSPLFDGRTRIETHDLVGCFCKRIVLRNDLSGRPTFRKVLGRVRDVWRAAFLNQDIPLELVYPDRGPAHPEHWTNVPSFNFTEGLTHALEIPGLASSSLQPSLWFPSSSLQLLLIRREKDLELVLTFRRALFSPFRMRAFLSGYRTLLEKLAAAPDEQLPVAAASAGYWDQLHCDVNVAG